MYVYICIYIYMYAYIYIYTIYIHILQNLWTTYAASTGFKQQTAWAAALSTNSRSVLDSIQTRFLENSGGGVWNLAVTKVNVYGLTMVYGVYNYIVNGGYNGIYMVYKPLYDMTNSSPWEMTHRNRWFVMVYLLKIVIFHGEVLNNQMVSMGVSTNGGTWGTSK